MGIEVPDDLARQLEDALYVSVGFGVLALQRAQVRRRELARVLSQLQDELRAAAGRAPG
ncbi:MAG TPA: hypothetical protein VNT56_05705 [Acidimicrobiales bacterium]|jgi:hypothetical protein|nr:hypothetical protein [Acidimicrobiales bacterium]